MGAAILLERFIKFQYEMKYNMKNLVPSFCIVILSFVCDFEDTLRSGDLEHFWVNGAMNITKESSTFILNKELPKKKFYCIVLICYLTKRANNHRLILHKCFGQTEAKGYWKVYWLNQEENHFFTLRFVVTFAFSSDYRSVFKSKNLPITSPQMSYSTQKKYTVHNDCWNVNYSWEKKGKSEDTKQKIT